MQDIKIDLVYLWVYDKDEEWQKKRRFWADKLGISENPQNNDEVRFRDNGELKYSLRSVQMFAPWINKIFIVTDGQVPKWLDTGHPKIKIVDHKEIIPDKALPTFNSRAIETCITNIPELSEYFLYANDDMFFSNPVEPEYFYDEEHKPLVRLRKQHWTEEEIASNLYLRSIINTTKIFNNKYDSQLEQYEPAHCIDAYRKSYFLECKNIFKDEFTKTMLTKFRQENTVQRYIVSLYMIQQKKCKLVLNSDVYTQNFSEQVENFYASAEAAKNLESEIVMKTPKLLCLNDSSLATAEDLQIVQKFFNKYFNQKAEWEKSELNYIEGSINKNCIVFSLNNDYVKFFAVALSSLVNNLTPEEKYDIVVLHNGINGINKKTLEGLINNNLRLKFFSVSDYLSSFSDFDLSVKDYWDISTYFRVFIPIIFKNYEKVLYCDSDIIFNSSLKELFAIKDENAEILAVRDSIIYLIEHERFKERVTEVKNELGLKNPYDYFNAGVVMFNLNNLKDSKNYIERLKKAFSKPLKWQDQDVLNIVFEGRVKFISWIWNMQYHLLFSNRECIGIEDNNFMQDFLNASKNPNIIHYTSPVKPWNNPEVPYAPEFWQNARKTPYYEAILQTMTETQIINSAKETTLYIKCNSDDRIVFWGASLFLEKFIKKYNLISNNIIGIIDKNPVKKGKFIGQYKIFAPEDLGKLKPQKIIITIVNSARERAQEVREYCKENNIQNISIETI